MDLVLYRDGVKTLLDVTIRNPCAPSIVQRASHHPLTTAKKGEQEKLRKYANRPPQVHFVLASFESFGAWGDDFARFFTAVARTSRHQHRDNVGHVLLQRRMLSGVSSELAKAIASHMLC